MNSDKIGPEIDDSIKGLEETIKGITRKADHELNARFETPTPQSRRGRDGVFCAMAPLGKREDLINHRLCSDLDGLHPIFFQHTEGPFIQGIGTGGDADGIDQARREKGLNLF